MTGKILITKLLNIISPLSHAQSWTVWTKLEVGTRLEVGIKLEAGTKLALVTKLKVGSGN